MLRTLQLNVREKPSEASLIWQCGTAMTTTLKSNDGSLIDKLPPTVYRQNPRTRQGASYSKECITGKQLIKNIWKENTRTKIWMNGYAFPTTSRYDTYTTTTMAVLRPLYRATRVTQQLQLRTGRYIVGTNFTALMPLLTATITFGLERRC